jgi:hypothetical protein
LGTASTKYAWLRFTNGNVNTSYQQDESDDKLQENVLYVPATEFDITGENYSRMEGNYSTVDEDMRKSSNEIFSMEDNYKTVELVEHLERNCSHPVNSELGQTKRKLYVSFLCPQQRRFDQADMFSPLYLH